MEASTKRTLDEAQARKSDALISLLERIIQDVQAGRLYGEFGVSFTAQGGSIGHYEE